MLLSPAEITKLVTEIQLLHVGFVAKWIGVDVLGLSAQTWTQLRETGMVVPAQAEDFVLQAYRFGHASAWYETSGGKVPRVSVAQMLASAEQAGLPPLSPVQRASVQFAREKAARYIVGLGNRVAADFTTLSIETEATVRAETKAKVATEVTRSIVNRETASKLASRLGDATGDWSRNLQRIAETELQSANQEGWADYVGGAFGAGAMVAKVPDPEACATCRRLFLGRDGRPEVFSLAALRANGTNFGVKQREWKPTVGPVHPRCHCMLIHVPIGSKVELDGSLAVAG